MSGMSEDQVATMLRDTLRREGDTVEPGTDGLRRIRQAASAHERRPDGLPRRVLMAAAAGVALGGGTAGGILTVMRDGADGEPQPGQVLPPNGEVTNDVGEAAPRDPEHPEVQIVDVYMVLTEGDRERLVRERRRVSLDDVLDLRYLAQPSQNPRYRTYWSSSIVLEGYSNPSEITVSIRESALDPQKVKTVEQATIAVQQFLWTFVENSPVKDTRRHVPVTILVEGQQGFKAWGLLTLGEPMRPDPSFLA